MDSSIELRQAMPGKVYVTSRGLKIKLVRQRVLKDEYLDEYIVISLASGGHELVLVGDTVVVPDNSVSIMIPPDLGSTALARLQALGRRIVQESKASIDELGDITVLTTDEIQETLNRILARN